MSFWRRPWDAGLGSNRALTAMASPGILAVIGRDEKYRHARDGLLAFISTGMLGLYVYLGALTEQLLLSQKPKTGTMKAD